MLQSCSSQDADNYKGYETPHYEVLEKIDEFEIRKYSARIVSEIEVQGDRQEAARGGFKALAQYIFGKNLTDENVKMTSPVEQFQNNSDEKNKWVVRFSMPTKYGISDLPKAINREIKFHTLDEHKAVALKFSGKWSDENINVQREKLAMFIWRQGLKTKGEEVIAYYDSPFTFPWNRRNEILWEIE